MAVQSYDNFGKNDFLPTLVGTIAPPLESHDHNLGSWPSVHFYNGCTILPICDCNLQLDSDQQSEVGKLDLLNDCDSVNDHMISLMSMVKMIIKLGPVT